MSSTPFNSAHQKNLRALVGKVLPGARAQHIAEALAAGYGFPTHKAFGAAVRAVEARRRPFPAPDFDADRLIARLHELGEDVGGRGQALRLLLGVMSDGPRSGPLAEPDAPERGPGATVSAFTKASQWREAGAVLSKATPAGTEPQCSKTYLH